VSYVPRSFEAMDRFEIAGRGTVIVVRLDRTTLHEDLQELVGRVAFILNPLGEATEVTVRGVESFPLRELRKGMPIGLLVREDSDGLA